MDPAQIRRIAIIDMFSDDLLMQRLVLSVPLWLFGQINTQTYFHRPDPC